MYSRAFGFGPLGLQMVNESVRFVQTVILVDMIVGKALSGQMDPDYLAQLMFLHWTQCEKHFAAHLIDLEEMIKLKRSLLEGAMP